jgi:DNA invertase Pin-like site-specific DNA recombinase
LKKCVVRCHSCHTAKTKTNGEYGISYPGTLNYGAVVNEHQLEQIRELYSTGMYTYQEIADLFNIGRSTVGHMVTGYRYKD